MSNLIKNDNQLFKDTLIELSLIAVKAGISTIPLASMVVDLTSGYLKLSNEEDVRNYIKILENKIGDLELQVDELIKSKAYQQFNQKKLIDLKPYYSNLDLEIEAQLAVGISLLDLSQPINQMVLT